MSLLISKRSPANILSGVERQQGPSGESQFGSVFQSLLNRIR